MKRVDFDVIVVGAGAGGATAAYYLVQAGLEVLVVDKAQLPRYKACGGAIPRPTLDHFPFVFNGIIEAKPTSVRFSSPGLPSIDIPLPEKPVIMVMRSQFDAFLLAQSNAEIMPNTTVTAVTESNGRVEIKAGEKALTARYLIGADGATSIVSKHLGLRQGRRLGGALETNVPLNGNGHLRETYSQRAHFALSAVPWGYAWVFPKDNSLSVGIARFKPGVVDLRSALKQQMDLFGISLESTTLHGHPLPCYQAPPWPFWHNNPQERLSTQRCLLVGDAAGLVDPLIGEGIRYAIASARLASQAIIRDDLSSYESAIWREIGHSLATAELTANLVYRFPKTCYTIGVRNPAVIRQLADIMTEKRSFEGIGRRVIAATLQWPISHTIPNTRS